jgi:hypothetical protein
MNALAFGHSKKRLAEPAWSAIDPAINVFLAINRDWGNKLKDYL